MNEMTDEHAAQETRHEHLRVSGWSYHRLTSQNFDPYWTFHPEDGVEARIYDQEAAA